MNEETMPQIDRLNEIRAILRDRMDRRDIGAWCQMHLKAINSGGPAFAEVVRKAEEQRCRSIRP